MTAASSPHVLIVGGGGTGGALVHDLTLRGVRVTLVERGEFTSGTTGRHHGLLHSGARYAVNDAESAVECIEENMLLRRIAPGSFEENDGLFVGVTDVGAHYSERVTYHPTCHSLRALQLGDAPHALLRAVDGLEFVELPGASECCGFGGTFAIKNAETSSAILESKLENIAATSADVVTAVDRSCLTQIGGGLSRAGSEVRTMHIAEILAATR